MHHHQAESGMKKKKGRERDGVARRHGVSEVVKVVGNKEMIIPVKIRMSRLYIIISDMF